MAEDLKKTLADASKEAQEKMLGDIVELDEQTTPSFAQKGNGEPDIVIEDENVPLFAKRGNDEPDIVIEDENVPLFAKRGKGEPNIEEIGESAVPMLARADVFNKKVDARRDAQNKSKKALNPAFVARMHKDMC